VTHVKVCGVTSIEDAIMCADLGVSAIGLNFVPSSPRVVDLETARQITLALAQTKNAPLIVGVVADLDVEAMLKLKADVGLGCLQLHGHEPSSLLEPLLPHAYKAIRIASEEDVALALTYPGDHLLVDAKVGGGALGGTGHAFDWSLVTEIARKRRLTLAGGLNPTNVARAIEIVKPYCVDVASGVESSPRKKDRALVEAFVRNAL